MPPPIPTIEVKEAIAAMTSISSTLFICVEVCLEKYQKLIVRLPKLMKQQ